MDRLKFCKICQQIKSWEAFRLRKTGRPYAYCIACDKPRQRAYSVSYYQEGKKSNRIGESKARHLFRRYGLTLEDYEALKTKCNQQCLICKKVTKLHVDHNHTTGHIRGMLCGPCNKGLGQFYDDPLLLKAAALYLEEKNGV